MNYFLNFIFNLIKKVQDNRKITSFDLNMFLRQFSTLFAAGIPIIKTCEILVINQEKLKMRILIHSIKNEILQGNPLSAVLLKYPTYFDALTIQLIQLGEHTGKLDVILNNIANHWEKNFLLKKRIWQALFYPCLIGCTAILVTISMVIFVIPRFAELFQDSYDKLPLITIFMFHFADLCRQYFWIPLILISFFIMKKVLIKKNSLVSKKTFLFLITKLPFIKNYYQKMILAQFARNLAIAFNAGISIVDALGLISQINSIPSLTQSVAKLRMKINSGLSLHQAMQAAIFFPAVMIQMVKIGEESGKLDEMLDKIAQFFEADVEQFILQASQLLEPLIMLMLGVLIGGLVISMYLPIFKLGTQL